jgi:hypothetical protein
VDSQATRRSVNRAAQPPDYFDDTLGLWVEFVEGDPNDPESPSGDRYTVDEEGTIDAGHAFSWVSGGDGTEPFTIRMETIITAGNYAGLDEETILTSFPDGRNEIDFHAIYPHEGTFDYEGSWDVNGLGTVEGKFTLLDGTWERYVVSNDEAPGAQVVFETSAGVTVSLAFAEDGSGTGTITGNGEGLPAAVAWDIEGEGLITWSDGTTSEVFIPNLVGGVEP